MTPEFIEIMGTEVIHELAETLIRLISKVIDSALASKPAVPVI